MIFAILLRHIFDYFASPFVTKIDIKVRHADALNIEKAFKKQTIFERVNIGNTQSIGGERRRSGTAARPYHYPFFSGIANKVPDDQIIVGKAHFNNDFQFNFQPLPVLLLGDVCRLRHKSFFQTRRAKLSQIISSRITVGCLKMWQGQMVKI